MTQDALPADNRLLEELTAPFLSDDRIAVSYARQLPEKDSGEIERFTRAYNYPEESCVKGKEQLSEMGIKTYFCSNVCAAYKKDIYQELGGFVRHTIFNEDMMERQARCRRDGRFHMRQAQGYIILIIIPAGNSSAGTLTTGFPRPSIRIFFLGYHQNRRG